MNDKNKRARAELEALAIEFATEKHAGQLYDVHPYPFHLKQAADVAKSHDLSRDVRIACWLHDVMEDCGVPFHEVSQLFGEVIAEIVYCVTDELGRNRKERKAKTYPKIRANELAVQVKLCDRIANFEHALETGSRHLAMYRKEYAEFKQALHSAEQGDQTQALWARLDESQ